MKNLIKSVFTTLRENKVSPDSYENTKSVDLGHPLCAGIMNFSESAPTASRINVVDFEEFKISKETGLFREGELIFNELEVGSFKKIFSLPDYDKLDQSEKDKFSEIARKYFDGFSEKFYAALLVMLYELQILPFTMGKNLNYFEFYMTLRAVLNGHWIKNEEKHLEFFNYMVSKGFMQDCGVFSANTVYVQNDVFHYFIFTTKFKAAYHALTSEIIS